MLSTLIKTGFEYKLLDEGLKRKALAEEEVS